MELSLPDPGRLPDILPLVQNIVEPLHEEASMEVGSGDVTLHGHNQANVCHPQLVRLFF